MISVINSSQKDKLEKIKKRSTADFELVLDRIKPVIKDIKVRKDEALSYYSKKYDNFKLTKNNIAVPKEEIKRAYKKVSKKFISAIKKAKKNIERYERLRLPKEWLKEVEKGIKLGQLVIPLERVGCYVPGGNFPLVSSVLMTAVPAKVAGVKEVIVCSPPRKDNWEFYVTCDIAGVDKIYRVGGPQAIAAMAYGTESIEKVDKIVGPGNIFVTAAKKLVYGDVGIDFLAGPSEVLIIAEKGKAESIAADMIAQAEHDRLASAILLTTDKKLAYKVKSEVNKQLKEFKNFNFASESLRKYGAIVICKDIDECFDIANDFAPEHLEIFSDDNNLLKKVNNAGAVFLGSYSPEAAGDYLTGPNHVLPTGGVSRFRAGLSVLDFIKLPTVQELSKDSLKKLKDSIIEIAKVEGLEGHRKSVEKRFN